MESFGLLFDLFIKWGVAAIAFLGILRLFAHRNDGKKHWLTKILTAFFALLAIFIFARLQQVRNSQKEKIVGDYHLVYYKCEYCPDCIVRLKKDETYSLIKDGIEIDNGNWDFSENLLAIFLKIENGSKNDILDSTRTISYIKNDGCQAYWRNQNFQQRLNGTIISIDSINTHYGVFSFFYLDAETNDTLQYDPKFIGHPWLNDKISVGCFISKQKNSLTFKIRNTEGEIFTISK